MTWAAATSASIAARSARRMLRRLTCFQDVEQGSRTVYSVSLRLVDEPQDPGGSQLVNRPLRCRERDAQSLLHERHRAVRVLSDDVNELQSEWRCRRQTASPVLNVRETIPHPNSRGRRVFGRRASRRFDEPTPSM